MASCPSSSASSSRISLYPMIAFIGVRNSWLMLARNALFVRLASSAATCASCNRSFELFSSLVRLRILSSIDSYSPPSSSIIVLTAVSNVLVSSLPVISKSARRSPAAARCATATAVLIGWVMERATTRARMTMGMSSRASSQNVAERSW